MGTPKSILVSSVLVVWLISGYSAHSLGSGRRAKILEEPIVSQANSYEVISSSNSKGTALQDTSDRSLSVEHNMMLYRSIFTLSLKLLTVFVISRLLISALTNAGVIRPSQSAGTVPIVPFPGQPNLLYTVDVNHNPGIALQGTTAYAGAGNALVTGSALSSISTGAAAGASSGTAPLGVAPVPASGYLTAASNSRPSFLVPGAAPRPRFRFGFGGPRFPPFRRPPQFFPPQHHNVGEETHYVDTHSHLFVMPDGTQARVPISQTASIPQVNAAAAIKSNAATSATSNNQEDSKTDASSNESTTERAPVESVNISTSSSSSSAAAERRSSNVFREKTSSATYLDQLQHQPYNDWSLHFSPGA